MQPNDYEIPEEKLKEWEEIEKKATQGPWSFLFREQLDDKESDVVILQGIMYRPLFRVMRDWLWRNEETGECGDAENGQFIATARFALPHLLYAYRKQREEIERLNKGYDALSKMMVTWVKTIRRNKNAKRNRVSLLESKKEKMGR